MSVCEKSSCQIPCEHDRVTVILTMHIDDELKCDQQAVTFDLGHAEDFGVIKVIDDLTETLELGGQSVLQTSSTSIVLSPMEREYLQLYDSADHKIHLCVRLQDIQKLKKFWELSESEKLLLAQVMKRRGNKLVKSKLYSRAFRTYKLAISYLQGSASAQKPIQPLCDEDASLISIQPSPEACQLLVLCLANAALCLLRLATSANQISLPNKQKSNELKRAPDIVRNLLLSCIKYCKKATELDPSYAKSWFRLAQAHAELGDFAEAVQMGEQCLKCVRKTDTSETATSLTELTALLSKWRMADAKANQSERSTVRKAVIQRYQGAENWVGTAFFDAAT
ncbi:Tetratricopeptide repeat protein [Paragonimus heterotremus]|uniref:Tetratricopeptide repeat protein n=1 Tax=Paragonimus heterotremus TaxID=100268 RepID=A0A8J4TJF8_9TREM|nr:Tetratricopeptide repeat protein [Paragonimus heterotremus]